MLQSEKAAQPGQLRFSKVLHVRVTLPVTEDGAEGAQHHFVQRVQHFAALRGVRQPPEGCAQALDNAQIRQ